MQPTNNAIYIVKNKNDIYGSLVQRTLRAGLSCLFLLALTTEISGQETSVTTYKALGGGLCAVQDTYLSPEEYKGGEIRYISHTIRQKSGKRWETLIINEGYGAYGKSRSENGATISGAYHFLYGRLANISIFNGAATLKAGGQGEITAGMVYNTRNGNNPAQAIAAIALGPVVRIEYPVKRMLISYEATCPLAGLTFSPNYGQSYYEIFNEGHYDHNVVPTTIAATPSLRHTLCIDVPIGKMKCLFGIYGDYRQQQVNNLKRHIYTSGIIVGMIRKFNVGRAEK